MGDGVAAIRGCAAIRRNPNILSLFSFLKPMFYWAVNFACDL